MPLSVTVQDTPNPNALRFLLDRPVQEDTRGRFYTDRESADDALATVILEVAGVTGVMLLPASVTVNKDPEGSWDTVEPAVRQVLESYFA